MKVDQGHNWQFYGPCSVIINHEMYYNGNGSATWRKDFHYRVVCPELRRCSRLRQGRSHGEQGFANGRVLFSQYDGRGRIRTGLWKWTATIFRCLKWDMMGSTSSPATFFFFFSNFCKSHSAEKIILNILLMNDCGINLDKRNDFAHRISRISYRSWLKTKSTLLY